MGPMDVGSAGFVVAGWLLTGVFACVPTFYLFRWWTDATISGAEAVIGALVIAFLMLMMIAPTPDSVKGMIFLMLLVLAVGTPFLYLKQLNASERQLVNEQEQVYRKAIESNPRNVAARVELARNLYPRGHVSEALYQMEAAIRLSPQTTDTAQRLLERWKSEQAGVVIQKVICRFCHEATPMNQPECAACGRPQSTLREIRDDIASDFSHSLKIGGLIGFGLLIAGGLLSLLNGWAANLLIMIGVTALMVWIWRQL